MFYIITIDRTVYQTSSCRFIDGNLVFFSTELNRECTIGAYLIKEITTTF